MCTPILRSGTLALLLVAISLGEAAARVRVEAFRGEVWGVAKVSVDLAPGVSDDPLRDDRLAVVESTGRVLYSVQADTPVRNLVGGLLSIDLPRDARFYFLFRGDEPLDLTVFAPQPVELQIAPRHDPRKHQRLLREWWREYTRLFERVHRESEYPIVVQNYLTATWARRLGQPVPEPPIYVFRRREAGGSIVARLVADEAYRASVERDLLVNGPAPVEALDMPLPPPAVVGPLALGDAAEDVAIEPIAAHVPQECFYLRFGNFPNYLWFRDFLSRWRGDVANMVVLRSINRDIGPKIEEQIALRESQLARILGPSVIEDVAMIGLDPYFRDGPAFGILFHAKNNFLLSRNFRQQRSASLERHADAKEETLVIEDHEVSLLSTPDGRVRSYYAVDGDFHLVTTCRRMVERFYASGRGEGSLATSAEFQATRAQSPITGNHTIFAYLSAAFFENLSSAHYRVELDRRLRSVGEVRTLRMARLAAAAEDWDARNVDDLIAVGLLPEGFGQRPDGTVLVDGDGGGPLRDSHRGVPGWFLPVADMPVETASQSEMARYQAFRQTLRSEVGRFVPLTATVFRDSNGNPQFENIALEMRLAPFSQTRLAEWARMLGPTSTVQLAPIVGDVVAAEIVLTPLGKPMHLFAGIRDFYSPLVVRQGVARPAGAIEEFARGYVGAWPRLYLLDRIFGPPGPVDVHGFGRARGLLGLLETWHRRIGDFFVFSFQRDVLMEIGPQLAMVEGRPAQMRVRIDSLHDKQLGTTIAGMGYSQARQTSASGSRFMNSLATQLHVPRGECRQIAEELIAGTFDCPLGGDYILAEEPGGLPTWVSTAVPAPNRFLLTEIPADYQMPLLGWFRGLASEVVRDQDAFTLRAQLAMLPLEEHPLLEEIEEVQGEELPAPEKPGWSLPGFDFLNGLGKPPAQQESQEELPEPIPAGASE